jgi:prepilin-type processing-associated H-X9-DG protein
VIVGQNNGTNSDHRGDIYNDDYNCAEFMAATTPNSRVPDQHGATTYCQYPNGLNPPCNANTPVFNAARSFHRGGVNATFIDGSVKFIKDSINIVPWRALSTTQGADIVSSDSY